MVKCIRELPPSDRKSESYNRVFSFLDDKEWLSWKQLYEKAEKFGMSRATLSRHLKEMVKLGLVERRVDTSRYPPKVYYKRGVDPFKMAYMLVTRFEKVLEASLYFEEYFLLLDVGKDLKTLLATMYTYSSLTATRLYTPILNKIISDLPKGVCEEIMNFIQHGGGSDNVMSIIDFFEKGGMPRDEVERRRILLKEYQEKYAQSKIILKKAHRIRKLMIRIEILNGEIEKKIRELIPRYENYDDEKVVKLMHFLSNKINILSENVERNLIIVESRKIYR